ncbi:hypothetical protein FRC02_009142 [Tulasnella sp. 418]|nr:hypothetical protein FRC02_009142 [Tulasnella sp. 418]
MLKCSCWLDHFARHDEFQPITSKNLLNVVVYPIDGAAPSSEPSMRISPHSELHDPDVESGPVPLLPLGSPDHVQFRQPQKLNIQISCDVYLGNFPLAPISQTSVLIC